MLKSISKKMAVLLLAIGCSAAFAFPPPYFFCNKQCIKEGPRGSEAYQECMADCMSDFDRR